MCRWVRDNSSDAKFDGDETGLYFGKLNRYYYDAGFGKFIFCNNNLREAA